MRLRFWIVIAAVLACTNVATVAYLASKAHAAGAYASLAQNPLIDPFRHLEKREDLIVNIQPLREQYEAIGKNKDVSIYFEYLATGANIAINKDAEFFPASLLKLPVAMAAVKEIEEGRWRWNDIFTLLDEDRDAAFGTLHQKPVGSEISVEELIRRMLVDSDNTAYRMLFRHLGADAVNDIYVHLGLAHFFTEDGLISAKRYSVILRSLYTASYLTPEDSQKLLSIMTETPFREYAGAPLPDSVRFAHKIGLNDAHDAVLDAGIVYAPGRPYILTVMVRTNDLEHAKKIMRRVSELAYAYVSSYHAQSDDQ